jgi:hypothetical protein
VRISRVVFSSCFFRPLVFAFSSDGNRLRNLRLATGSAFSSFMNARSTSSRNGAPVRASRIERLKYSAHSSVMLRPVSSSPRNGFARNFQIVVPFTLSS